MIVFPTDTLYGLGVDPRSPAGLAALFRLKGRDPGKPFPVLLADAALVGRYAAAVPAPWRALMGRFWPGPLTLLFPALAGLPRRHLLRVRKGRPPGPRQRAVPLGAAGGRGEPHRHQRQRRGRRRHGRSRRSRCATLRDGDRSVRERGNFAPLAGIYLLDMDASGQR